MHTQAYNTCFPIRKHLKILKPWLLSPFKESTNIQNFICQEIDVMNPSGEYTTMKHIKTNYKVFLEQIKIKSTGTKPLQTTL